MRKIKVTDLKRVLISIGFLLLLVASVFILCGATRGTNKVSGEEAEYIKYTVEAGDTLWSIAYQTYGDSYDTRRGVYDIREYNNLTDCNIKPNDVILIPLRK